MIVREVGRELRSRGAATVSQLTAELGAERSIVESALAFWVHRRSVTVCRTPASACGTSCRRCPIGAAGAPVRTPAEVFEWVKEAT